MFGSKKVVTIPFGGKKYNHEDEVCKTCGTNPAKDSSRCAHHCQAYETIKRRREKLESGMTIDEIMAEEQGGRQEHVDMGAAAPTAEVGDVPPFFVGMIWGSPGLHAKYLYRVHKFDGQTATISYTFSDRPNMIQLLQPYADRTFTVEMDMPWDDLMTFFQKVVEEQKKYFDRTMSNRSGGGDRGGFHGGGNRGGYGGGNKRHSGGFKGHGHGGRGRGGDRGFNRSGEDW